MSNESTNNAENAEEIVNVPLRPAVKAALEKRADENGRATKREAARIITDVLAADAKGGAA